MAIPENVRSSVRPDVETEVARLIVETLNVDADPVSVDPFVELFGEGLGFDSIDALEIALVVSKTYGIEIRREDTEKNRENFRCLRSLSLFIEKSRTR